MSNSLLTDGWALPVSIWDRALALIPRRLAISRSPIPWPRRSARSRRRGRGRRGRNRLPGRSSPVAVMPGSVQSAPTVQRHWTRAAPARHGLLFVEEEQWPTGSCCVAAPS